MKTQAETLFTLLTNLTEEPSTFEKEFERPEKETSIYIDGAFDLVHSGHFNAIRQAAALATQLVVGVNTDEDILIAKGPTILNIHERRFIIESCKWVDKVVDTPYIPTLELLDGFGCEFYGHGDDPFYDKDGVNMLEYFNSFGRLKLVKRTTGISTTALTGRLLALAEEKEGPTGPKEQFAHLKNPPKQQFLQMGSRMRQFSNNKVPKPGDRVVYYSASCDLFHPSVIRRIQAAKKQGDFLYVGLWDDEMVRYYLGSSYPLVSLQERSLMALACRYVDDVVIGSPYILTRDLLVSLNIGKVVHVKTADDAVSSEYADIDPYQTAKEMGIYEEIEAETLEEELTVQKIALRVLANKELLEAKFARKTASEALYYQNKEGNLSE